MIIFSLENHKSLSNVTEKWKVELTQHCPGVPIVLVGNKADLRNDPEQTLIRQDEAEVVAQQNQFVGYFECSAKEMRGLNQAFDAAFRAGLAYDSSSSSNNNYRRSGCSIT